MPEISNRICNIIPKGSNDGWELHFEALGRKQAGENILMLSVGDHEFPTPAGTVEACIAELRAGHHHYTQLAGLPQLRRAMARLSTRSTGVETSSDEILATIGGQAALFASLQATLDPGDHGIIISPYYATYPGTMNATGAQHSVVEARAENGFQPLASDIRAELRDNTRVLLINSPNNPTGAVYSRDTLKEIAQICIERDLWLISDEVYWTHTGPDHPHISPISLPRMNERTLIVNSLSKSHGMTGWRIGWLRGPTDFIKRLTNLNLVSSYGLNDFVSRAAIQAIENEYGVEEIAERYASRRKQFLDILRGLNAVTVRGSEGGMYIMLDVRKLAASGEEFAWSLLETENMAILPGEGFGHAAAGHVRISLCQPDAMLEEAANRLKRFISSKIPVS